MTNSETRRSAPRIFINYRRDDAAGHAGRLYDALAARLGSDNVLMDVDAIEHGENFATVLDHRVGSCEVFVAMIGRRWVDAVDRDGRRRIERPDDYVRLELQTALALDRIRVIPALVQGAEMPVSAGLPPELRDLVYRQAIELRDASWRSDVERLLSALNPLATMFVEAGVEDPSGRADRWVSSAQPASPSRLQRSEGAPVSVDVFVSVGRISTHEQEQFVAAVERCLLEQGLQPHTLGRTDWSSAQPMTAVRELMQRCSGTAVIAFERLHITEGVDRAGREADVDIRDVGLPTVWNQIEAAMAHVLGLPLLVFAERGLRNEGLLESRYDWMVQWVELDPEALRTNPCLGMVDDWTKRVVSVHERRSEPLPAVDAVDEDVANKTVAQILGQLRPGQLRALIAGCIAVLGAVFTLGATMGGG